MWVPPINDDSFKLYGSRDPPRPSIYVQVPSARSGHSSLTSFLAFCSLSRTVSTPVAEIASPDPNEAPSLVPTARLISLSKCLRHAPILALASILSATRTRFAALEQIINAALSHGLVYPWRAFAAFAPEKVFSDMIEAVFSAVYIDTAGDLRAYDALLRRFGITDWVKTTLKKEV